MLQLLANWNDGDLRSASWQGIHLPFAELLSPGRPGDAQQFGQKSYEDPFDPRCHPVCGRRSEVDVEHNDGHQDGQRHQDHGK